MSLFELATAVGYGVAGLAFAGVLLALRNRPDWLDAPRRAGTFAAVWGAVVLAEFYVFGPASFISMNSEGDLLPPMYSYLLNHHAGGQFAFPIAGGNDVATVLGFGTQLFSHEKMLFAVFPDWIAIFLLKVFITAIGFGGTYLLCRRGFGCGRTISLGAAALFTVSHIYLVNIAILMGAGFAVLPLIVYLAVALHAAGGLAWRLSVIAVLAALAQPVFVPQAIAAAIVGGAILLLPPRPGAILRGVVAPLLAVAVGVIVNWHDVLLAMSQVSLLTERGLRGGGAILADTSFANAVDTALVRTNWARLGLGCLIAGSAILAIRRSRLAWRAAAVPVVLVAGYVVILLFPWDAVGLDPVRRVSLHYYYLAFNALGIPVLARALEPASSGQQQRPAPWRGFGAPAMIAAAAAMMVWFKVGNAANLLYYGGQSQYTTIGNLARPDWGYDPDYRVVTLRHQRPEPNLAFGYYGMNTFDAAANLIPDAYSTYWREGILRGDDSEGFFGRLPFFWTYFDGDTYDIGRQADLDLLRAANVRYLLSPVPLKGLRRVSGPEETALTAADGLGAFAADRLAHVFDHGDVYVHELPDPLPRVYAAAGVVEMNADADDADMIGAVRDGALDRKVVARGPLAFPPGGDSMAVTGVSFGVDRILVTVDAPDGGVLAVNVNWYPYWRATVDGRNADVHPVSFVQMAVPVPRDATRIELRYHRPTLSDVLAGKG